jgi:hypothetical protein
LESVAPETNLTIATAEEIASVPESWDDVLFKIQSYLLAWRIGDEDWLLQSAREILESTRKRISAEPHLGRTGVAIEEADAFLCQWFAQLSDQSSSDRYAPSLEERVAFLLGAPRGDPFPLSDAIQLSGALRQGTLNFARALTPSRPPESRAITMQTSLSRLPSFRLIAGWFLLIGLLLVLFLLTH